MREREARYLLRFGDCLLSIITGTQLVSSVQSACKPQLQPVENLEKSQDSCLPGRWHVHFFCPALQSHGCSKRIFLTRCLPKVVPPVFWMCRNTITSSPLMLKSDVACQVAHREVEYRRTFRWAVFLRVIDGRVWSGQGTDPNEFSCPKMASLTACRTNILVPNHDKKNG